VNSCCLLGGVHVPDDDESRRFEDIVADLRDENPAMVPPRPGGRRKLLIAGIICCIAAIALIAFGGTTGAVLAVIPWLVGMVLVVVGRPRA
jgi:hypothetical protein